MSVIDRPSPNHDERPAGRPVDMLVLHYTGMKTAEEALARLCDPAAKVSAHYTIDQDGSVYAHVPEARRAWHAGVSWWAGETNVNARSIGIELVNPGHEFGYVPFADAQIESLIDLAGGILKRHPIPAAGVVGHSDVAPARKTDPSQYGNAAIQQNVWEAHHNVDQAHDQVISLPSRSRPRAGSSRSRR